MIFVLDQYLKRRQAKIRAWEKARDAWKAEAEYHWERDNQGWARKHPYPVFQWDRFFAWFIPVAVCSVVIFSLVYVFFLKPNETSKSKPSASAQTIKKYDVKVNDKVQVVYGSFKDSVGVVVKLMEGNVAVIKLVDSSFTKAMCNESDSCGAGNGLDNGSLLEVHDIDKNLVPYKEIK